jgi:tetratricopeptide (TPR) repeat protein
MKKIINGLIFFLCAGQLYAQVDNRGVTVTNPTDTNLVHGNTYAIIIGISNYKNVPHLKFADKDAAAFKNFLLSDAGGKVPKNHIETFLNSDAVRMNVGDAISREVRDAKPGDRIYFFFAGHGDMEDLTQIENGLLLLYNSPDGNYFGMNDDVLEILDLKRYLSPLSERGIEIYFIIDACHSGNLRGGVQGEQQTATALAASWGKEFKILSCQPNQFSMESAEWGGGRGLFSFELEEGMEGLADKNNDGRVSLLELQQYLTDKVATLSDGHQIPLVSGDLSKCVAIVNPTVLAAVKKEQGENYPTLAKVNYKGSFEGYLDSADAVSNELYKTFKKNLEENNLILPKDSNAMYNYRAFEKRNPNNELTYTMKRDLAAALNEKFDSIVAPLLKGETSYSSREQCQYVSVELDSCLHLLGEQHYMYKNIEARKLYMDAMALTWALTEFEFNIAVNEKVQKAVDLLEQSEKLEPNAAYTISALGTRYYYLYQYKKAFEKFQKYLDLQPNDFYAKYTLANIFFKLKEYTKAETLLKALIDIYPEKGFLYTLLCDVYFDENEKSESLLWAKKALNYAKAEGYFDMAVYYQKIKNLDSAKYYYELSRADDPADITIDNNIGYAYLLNQNLDSALFYLNRLYKVDSTFPYVNFNLATIDLMQEKYYAAILKLVKVIDYSSSTDEVFIADLEMYFNQFNEFRNKVYDFNIQYMSYVSVLYCYLREPTLFTLGDKIELIFSRMKSYSEYDVYTYYHYACYKALQKNKTEALENLQKSLELGFGNYFMVTGDADLDYIRDTPEFNNLLKKYFPDKAR